VVGKGSIKERSGDGGADNASPSKYVILWFTEAALGGRQVQDRGLRGAPEVTVDGEPEDRRLVADHLAGDSEAFATLVRPIAIGSGRSRSGTLGDPEEAADASQDGLISAFRGAAGYRR